MIIGAKAIGAEKGFIYIRHEYPLALKRMDIADRSGPGQGIAGERHPRHGISISTSKIVQGAGAFVSGEETALLASVEGRIAMPRQRPPYPAQKGLWGKPTVINNVETWATVPEYHPPRGRRGSPAWEPRPARGPRSSPWWARSTTPGWSKSRWASPSATSSSASAAASPAGRSSRPSRRAVRPAAASRPASSTCRSTTRA